MDLHGSHFALFDLPERYAIDGAALDRAYRDVQTQVHPDRFAGGGAAEQRVALQWATRANEAYRVLRDPLQRARYLCVLRGEDPADEHNTSMSSTFLMQQLEWREALYQAKTAVDPTVIEGLRLQLAAALTTLQDEVEQALDRPDGTVVAVERVRQWMFVERFADDVLAAEQRATAVAR